MPMDVSVIIPAYNAAKTIGKTLDALSSQQYSGTYEVIVVDDGSMDETAQVVRGFTNVRFARQDNAGPAAARNHGARLASGDVLVFTDADCIPHADWLACLLGGLKEPDVGAVAGSYGIANPQNILARCVHAEILFRHAHLMPDHPKSFGSYNFCVKKNVFLRVGGFNEDYRRASGEDNDLSYRLQGQGVRIYFARKALVDHFHPACLPKYLKEQFRHGFWRVKMYVDHPRMAGGDGYTYWKDIAEVPWSLCCLAGLVLSALGAMGLKAALYYFLIPFFVFELLSARLMVKNLSVSIYCGFVHYLRAFFRAAGLSTGILCLLVLKMTKISK